MHTAIISFADRVVYNIKTNEMKDCILDLLYDSYGIKIIQRHYHKVDENNIKHIKANPHMCCLRSNGNPYYMFFTTYNEVPIIYMIDKKIHPGYQKPRILLIRGLFDEVLFKNTLIDGEMVKTNDNKWIYIMNDIIVHEGRHLQSLKLEGRLNILYDILQNKHTPESTVDVCEYKIKTYYSVSKESVRELIDISTKLNYTCRGMYFWSYQLKYKPKLYNFCEDNIISVVRKVKDETEFQLMDSKKIAESKQDTECKQDAEQVTDHADTADEKTMWLMQTDHPDVYSIFETDNNSKKIGIALIPNISTSKMIRNAFKNKNSVSTVKVRCRHHASFNKWFPVSVM